MPSFRGIGKDTESEEPWWRQMLSDETRKKLRELELKRSTKLIEERLKIDQEDLDGELQ